MAFGPDFWFLVFASAFQIAMGALFCSRWRSARWIQVVCVLFFLNGISAGIAAIPRSLETGTLPAAINSYLVYPEFATTFLIGYLASIYPQRIRFLRKGPAIEALWLGIFILFVLVQTQLTGPRVEATIAENSARGGALLLIRLLVRDFAPLAAFLILLLRFTHGLWSERGGMKFVEIGLLLAAFGIRAVNVGLGIRSSILIQYTTLVQGGLLPPMVEAIYMTYGVMTFALTFGTVLYVIYSLSKLLKTNRFSGTNVLYLVLLMMFLGAVESVFFLTPPTFANLAIINNIDVLIIRPAILFAAILRYNLFVDRKRGEGVALVGSSVLVAALTTISISQALAAEYHPVVGITIALFIGALTLSIVLLLLRRFFNKHLGPGVSNSLDMRRFVLELENYRGPTTARRAYANELGAQLGIPPSKADSLLHAVEEGWTQVTSMRQWGPGDSILQYQLLQQLGHGGGGEVYLAEDLLSNRRVVLKRTQDLSAKQRQQIRHEAKLLRSTNHPNIVELLALEELQSEPILVLAYAENGSLSSQLESGPLDQDHRIQLAWDLLAGLHALHQKRIVHQDLKPSNVFISKQNRYMLGDLGVSSSFEHVGKLGDPTPDVRHRGTPAYAAPEQLLGEGSDRRSDLFALGIVLFEATTGKHPWRRKGERTQVEQAILESPLPSTGVGAAWDRFLQKLCAKNPEARFQSVSEALQFLREENLIPAT